MFKQNEVKQMSEELNTETSNTELPMPTKMMKRDNPRAYLVERVLEANPGLNERVIMDDLKFVKVRVNRAAESEALSHVPSDNDKDGYVTVFKVDIADNPSKTYNPIKNPIYFTVNGGLTINEFLQLAGLADNRNIPWDKQNDWVKMVGEVCGKVDTYTDYININVHHADQDTTVYTVNISDWEKEVSVTGTYGVFLMPSKEPLTFTARRDVTREDINIGPINNPTINNDDITEGYRPVDYVGNVIPPTSYEL